MSEVRSFLAMANYVSRFIPNCRTTTEPLRKLIEKNVSRQWKSALSSFLEFVTTCFDPNKETGIITGLSPMMLQNNNIVSYASKALTDVESRYSQTE